MTDEANEKRYHQIDELVLAYRQGDVSAGAELLRLFRPLINKYVQLCLTGRVDPNDWVQMKVLRGIHPDAQVAGSIIKRCMARIDRDDIRADATLSLLQAALNWRNVSMGFRNLFLRRVLAYVRVATHEVLVSDIVDPDDESDPETTVYPTTSMDTDLDSLWVMGATAGPGFDELSTEERQLLYLAYWLGLSDAQIADRLNISQAEARARRQEAIAKAELYLKQVGRLK